jgi:chromosome segregation ATPase
MTKEKEKEEEEQLSRYEEMVKERLETLKEGFDNFPLAEGEDESTKLPGFIMMHIAQLYTRLDLTLGELEDAQDKIAILSASKEEVDPEYEDAKADFEKELAKEST